MAKYISLSAYGVELKNLISGPAPVGRILNYVNRAGNGHLKHKNGYRFINLINDVASAWCSEFMIGLGLVSYNPSLSQPVKLNLTPNGQKLFIETNKMHGLFDENQDPTKCRHQMLSLSPHGYELFKNIFLVSPVYLNLKAFIENKGTKSFKKGKSFNKLYWEEFLNEYSSTQAFDPNARTNAGDNRVPSLVQLCIFFKLCVETKTHYIFNLPSTSSVSGNVTVVYDQTDPYSAERVIETLNDFEDDIAVREAPTYDSQQDIDNANARVPSLKPGSSSNKRYTTDPKLAKTVLVNSGWKCALDGFDGHAHTTFDTKTGNKYLEAHHLVPMKAQKDFYPTNIDISDNIIPLCPNCHKAVHYGNISEKRRFLKPLYDARIASLKAHGINISFDDLINKYYS